MHKGCETNSCKQNIFVNLVDIGSFLGFGSFLGLGHFQGLGHFKGLGHF